MKPLRGNGCPPPGRSASLEGGVAASTALFHPRTALRKTLGASLKSTVTLACVRLACRESGHRFVKAGDLPLGIVPSRIHRALDVLQMEPRMLARVHGRVRPCSEVLLQLAAPDRCPAEHAVQTALGLVALIEGTDVLVTEVDDDLIVHDLYRTAVEGAIEPLDSETARGEAGFDFLRGDRAGRPFAQRVALAARTPCRAHGREDDEWQHESIDGGTTPHPARIMPPVSRPCHATAWNERKPTGATSRNRAGSGSREAPNGGLDTLPKPGVVGSSPIVRSRFHAGLRHAPLSCVPH